MADVEGTHVALLRGVNVGGHRRLPMARVRDALDRAGLGPVRTHIQSGNLVLSSTLDEETLAGRVAELLQAEAGFAVPTVVLAASRLHLALDANPFSPAEPKLEHVVFLPGPLDADLAARLRVLRDELATAAPAVPGDDLALGPNWVYLHHPHGLARSKLAERATRLLGEGTARNIATLERLRAMLR